MSWNIPTAPAGLRAPASKPDSTSASQTRAGGTFSLAKMGLISGTISAAPFGQGRDATFLFQNACSDLKGGLAGGGDGFPVSGGRGGGAGFNSSAAAK